METKSGYIIVATSDAGLLQFDETNNLFFSLNSKPVEMLSSGRISSAHSGRNETIWVGFESGDVAAYSIETGIFDFIQIDSRTRISSITESSDGNIYAAAADGRIFKIEATTHESIEISLTGLCLKKLSTLDDIASGSNRNLWLGTRGRRTCTFLI